MFGRNDHETAPVKGYASPYATGGGGTVFEHTYGAVLLARLLQDGPVLGLGEDVSLVEVRFQQNARYPVDDLVVVGRHPTGRRMMFVGVQRNPTIGASSERFVALLTDYLRMIVGHRTEFDADRWRLGLTVSGPHTASAELKALAENARRQRSDTEFRAAVGAPGATTGKIRERLSILDAAVGVAAERLGLSADGQLTWRLLRALRVIPLTLEGDDPADRSAVITELARLAGGVARATELWRHLAELSASYAPAAATVDRALLLRDLSTRIDVGTRPTPIRVSDTDPRRLGVHAPIDVDGAAGDLPSYVERDIDRSGRGVRSLLAKAAKRGGFVLLVGGSSVGKTRCAFEAIRAELPDWSLIHPTGAGDLAKLAAEPPARTVLWLDELHRYLAGNGGLTRGMLNDLLSAPAPVVIIGTIWPDRYLELTNESAGESRATLDLADIVMVQPEFSAAERERAERAAAHDPMLAAALRHTGYGLTQTLAAAPQLIRQWELAQVAKPYAWAVLLAAVDLTRLGAEHPLPEALLRHAAPGYCSDQQRAEAPVDWFEQAMEYATRTLRGATAALAPVGGPEMGQVAGYLLADYLLHQVGPTRVAQQVPASVWEATLVHLRDTDDVLAVAESASARLLYHYAVPLYRRAADTGNRRAADQWAVHVGDPAGLADLRDRAQHHDPFRPTDEWFAAHIAAEKHAEALVRLGAVDQLRALCRPVTTSYGKGHETSQRLAQLLADRGATDELYQLADRGDHAAAEHLADILARRGDGTELRARADVETRIVAAKPVWERSSDDQQTACKRLADYLAHREELTELTARTDEPATNRLFALLLHRGDVPELRRLAEARRGSVTHDLVRLLTHRGDIDQLMMLATPQSRPAPDQPDEVWGPPRSILSEFAFDRLARVFAHRNAVDKLAAIAPHAFGPTDRLVRVLADRGELDPLRELLGVNWCADLMLITVFVSQGDVAALRALEGVLPDDQVAKAMNRLMVSRGAVDELAHRARRGVPAAARELAFLLADRGNASEARRVLAESTRPAQATDDDLVVDLDELRARADSGDVKAQSRLADTLVRRGELDELSTRAAAGEYAAVDRLAEAYIHRGELDNLRALADTHRKAAEELADVLVFRGHVDELTIRADNGDKAAGERLIGLFANRGDFDALRRRTNLGDNEATKRLAEVLADRGEFDELRERADHDRYAAARILAEVLIDRGELDRLRARADNHDHMAASALARLLADRGELGELRARADSEDHNTRRVLAQVLADRGEIDELRARTSRYPDDFHAARRLVELLVPHGHLAEAEQVLLDKVMIGDADSARRLPQLMIQRGQHHKAAQVARFGLTIDGKPANEPQ